MRTAYSCLASLVIPVALYACANDDNTPPGPKTPGGIDASAPEAAADAPIDQAAKVPVRCTQAELDAVINANGGDFTGSASVVVTFPQGPGPAQYMNHCIKVKVGTKVTFTGSFASHPLEPNGGDLPTQIPAPQQTGTTIDITVTRAGTFGYQCKIHPGSMFGAIEVVP